jgi:hypothetical protein
MSALELRRALPEVALHMETDHLVFEAEKRGLVVSAFKGKKIARISFKLTHYHTLRISPVDKGANGVGEWFVYANCDDNCGKPHPEYVMRVHAEIIDQLALGENQIESVTVAGTSIDMVLREALGAYEYLTGKSLAPRFFAKGEKSQ